jgi:hypothetical protein
VNDALTNDEQIAISHAGETVMMPASEWIAMHSYATSMRERDRRKFAAMAMQGILSDSTSDGLKWSTLATQAVSAADALLAALQETPRG